ncbi:ABC transporter substrate-binding protein [Desulfobacterales bacterium HSG2]|nr:ABC transporter substrate-binding protein [Desulfobacterales bacterium HSG2]
MKKIIAVLFIAIISTPVLAYSVSPMDALRGPIDEVINILKDPQYQSDAQKEVQREKISSVIRKIFDFTKISQLALGKYRKKFKGQELEDFTDYFSRLLEKTYLNKIQAEYQNEKVNYLSQRVGSGKKSDKALVKTMIARENVEIPVEYKMWLNNNAWRVYDIKVEGVSLVKNYRNQFQKILLNKSPAHLIEQVKNKVEKKK